MTCIVERRIDGSLDLTIDPDETLRINFEDGVALGITFDDGHKTIGIENHTDCTCVIRNGA